MVILKQVIALEQRGIIRDNCKQEKKRNFRLTHVGRIALSERHYFGWRMSPAEL